MGQKLSVMTIAVIFYTLVNSKHKGWEEMKKPTGAAPCLRRSGSTTEVT